jgi:CRISPR-associated protein Cmr2
MPNSDFTAITFSPVTEFIEKTRKLRDLYGSSFILSYLAESVCREAQGKLGAHAVVSPALLNITMGTPDQILIQGNFTQEATKEAFFTAWARVIDACRDWVERSCTHWIDTTYPKRIDDNGQQQKEPHLLPWYRDWQHWKNHAWEVFWAQGATIPEALDALAAAERQRNWIGINWTGESSTLSGVDAIAYPGLGLKIFPKQGRMSDTDDQIRSFFQELNLKIGESILADDLAESSNNQASRLRTLATRYNITSGQREEPQHQEHQRFRQELAQSLGEAIVTNREQLSILELTKRLTTLKTVAQDPKLKIQFPKSFKDVNLWKTDQPMGWFRGDGDQAGEYVRSITQGQDAVDKLRIFSSQMRQWGQWLQESFDQQLGRIVFAGGDDFLGVFYAAAKPTTAMDWLSRFKQNAWHVGQAGTPDPKPITPSVGFVWASPQVPQRDVLQHCELAEQAAKTGGRDRVCLRVLFSSGTYLEWVCPWRFLPVLHDYCDRTQQNGQANWAHIFNDVAVLESRHAFQGKDVEGKPVDNCLNVALALFNIYFREDDFTKNSADTWDSFDKTEFYNLMTTSKSCNEPDYWEQEGLWNLYNGQKSYNAQGAQRRKTGILGDRASYTQDEQPEGTLNIFEAKQALTSWIINLAKVGFHLCSNT